MTAQEKSLIEFAKRTLELMEISTEWNADTLDSIASEAYKLRLAHSDGNAFFERTRPQTGVESPEACDHQTGYWINKPQGTFRCYKCGCQFTLEELPKMERAIETWRR